MNLLYYSHRTLHFLYFWSPNIWRFFLMEVFPQQAILCNINWSSYNLTQFWHSLPRDAKFKQ